ncbi:MAG: AAA family ATPase [Candidatus Magasanikbacteria bacterium]|nr:AAA family ATPase [Candidatus Magasanikbacteria bacterium]
MSIFKDSQQAPIIQERFKSLFEFLNAYHDLRTPVVRDISQQIATLWLGSLPKHPAIKLNEYTLTKEEKETDEDEDIKKDENDILLQVARPVMAPCPKPPEILSDWLLPGWTKIDQKAEVRDSRNVVTKEGETLIEQFDDKGKRQDALETWIKVRNEWANNEQSTWEAVKLFEKVYELYGYMDREGDRVELLIGEGIVECSDELTGDFRHPVLLRRLELEFFPEKKNPQFIIRRKEQPAELCVDFLRALPNLDTQQLVRCVNELSSLALDPLGQADTSGFLRRLIQGLFPNGGQYLDDNKTKLADCITIQRNPVIFLRERRGGLGHAIELLLKDVANRIQSGEEFSVAMMQILGIDHEEVILSKEEIEVSTFGNEDEEILLSKSANQEQLQIAKQLGRRSTVLVQGPPGTGKTHTIANLIGHLLSQGKRVLVTAQSSKALRVLRKEIVTDIQSLCVSVLQKEKQNIEELQKSVKDISVKLSQNEELLEKEVSNLRVERSKIIGELRNVRQKLFDAREDEIREIVFGGKGIQPIEAAKKVREHEAVDGWIPGPVNLGTGLPITSTEVIELYQTNKTINFEDEREFSSQRPDLSKLPTVTEFSKLEIDIREASAKDIIFGKEYWNDGAQFVQPEEVEQLVASASKAIEFFKDSEPWQMEAVQAGRDGDLSKKPWESFAEFIDGSWEEIQELNGLIMKYGPAISDSRPAHEVLPIINEIVIAIENGGSLGLFTKVTKRHWFQLLSTVQISERPIDLKQKEHLQAIQAHLRVISLRDQLRAWWGRQMVSGGAPTITELGEKPEQLCRQYITRIQNSLSWHDTIWIPLEKELKRLGFNWAAYLDSTKPEIGNNGELVRLRSAILGDFGKILNARSIAIRLQDLKNKHLIYQSQIPAESEKDGLLTRHLRQSVTDLDSEKYTQSYNNLNHLKALDQDFKLRSSLLKRISVCAPAWSSAIQMRTANHAQAQSPGNPESAWEWRQLHDELERRASVSLEDLQELIESLNKQLLEVTSALVAKQTWLKQIKTVRPEERRALNAYATLQAKKTKGGNGKKDEIMRQAARKEMEAAKGAVPVWIMPLSEVVENFSPLTTRFDVVIIDEASQCDPLAMLALYLGKQTIVVGDDEQVTPTAPLIETEEIIKLIRTYLDGIPHKEYYDGETSIYDFAKTVFGNVIRLVEHFRCAPDIIAFSNRLSYGGEIKPLREETSISLHPNVVPYRVEGKKDENDNINEIEVRTTAALVCAAIEQPEYKKKTFGIIGLLGDRQAGEIEKLLRAKLSPDVYQQRDIICGSPAHFQGDQRDVMFLSMVDSPSDGPLNLKDGDANRKLFRKRYNVAASRAKDQMWLVYSLNHETDLKPGDIRKRFIEHMLDPKAWQRELEEVLPKAESPFEEKVMARLLERGFKVQPQFRVGAYRIDMVINRVAIECDGERWHGPEKLTEDMDRQAILERLGWKFIHIRGSVFFRDPERAMTVVYRRLEELGITPERETSIMPIKENSELVERVRSRAQEIQREWDAQLEHDEQGNGF